MEEDFKKTRTGFMAVGTIVKVSSVNTKGGRVMMQIEFPNHKGIVAPGCLKCPQ